MRGIDDDHVATGVDQPFRALVPIFADRRRGGDQQPALAVFRGVRVACRLLDVLDGDEADAAVLVVDDDQLLDPVLVQQPLGLVLGDAAFHRHQVFARHQLVDRLIEAGREAHVAIGQNADEPALAGAAIGQFSSALHHRQPRHALVGHQLQALRRATWPARS